MKLQKPLKIKWVKYKMKAFELREIANNALIAASSELTTILQTLETDAAANGLKQYSFNFEVSAQTAEVLRDLGYTVTIQTSLTTITF